MWYYLKQIMYFENFYNATEALDVLNFSDINLLYIINLLTCTPIVDNNVNIFPYM